MMPLLLAALLIALSGAPAAAQKLSAERPSYAVGDTWVLNGTVYTLARIDKDTYVFTAPGGQEMQVTRDLAVARVVKGGRPTYEISVAPRWPWPLERKKFARSWAVARSAPDGVPPRGSEAAVGDFEVMTHVEAVEEITVPAGRFQTFKVVEEWSKYERGAPLLYWRTTSWYAPEARRIVKSDSSAYGLVFEATSVGTPPTAVASAPPPAPAPPPATVTPAPAVPVAPAPPAAARPEPPASRPPARVPAVPKTSPPADASVPKSDLDAPKIAINYPPADLNVESDSIVLLGLITDNVTVDRTLVTVNGVEVAVPRELSPVGRGIPIRVPVPLKAGANVIEVTASDSAGNVSQVVRTVTRTAPVVAAPATPAAPKISNRWAVVVGVGDYDNRTIPRLRFATRDAEAMYQFLTTQGGYPKDNVVLLTDATAQKPTLLNIKRALGEFLARRAGRDDMVLIYFAGHGAPEIDAAGNEADGLSKYLIPRDGDPDALYTTALPMDEIQRIFSRVAAERIVMLLDTCYSGTAGGRTFARASTRATGINDQFLDRLTRSRGRVIITASGPNEVALELPNLGHGVFTYFVLEGLKGKADRNHDGLVTVSELYEYVEGQVDSTARRAGGRQRPLMKGEIEGTLPLSKTR
jgi:uncharacterized caspase-like protein